MKRSHKIAAGIVASLTLGLATAALAQQGWGGPGPCATGFTQEGYGPGMGPGWRMGGGWQMGPASQRGPGWRMGPGFRGQAFGNPLMTPEEWAAHRNKMLNAASFEERQQIAAANHAEMQKRAAAKGITLPERRGPRFGAAPQAPATTE